MKSQWRVIHVSSRTEKKVAERLEKKEITNYLPLQKQLHRWSDRKKWIDTVVLSGYVFVKVTHKEFLQVLQTPGVSRFLKYNGRPVCISDMEMDRFRDFIEKAYDRPIEFTPENIPLGTLVTIQIGQFKGFSGEVVMHKGKHRLKIELSHIGNFSIVLSPDEVAVQA